MNRIVFALLALLVVLGCSENPLIGKWEVDAPTSEIGAASGFRKAGLGEMEFTETQMITGRGTQDVTYSLEGEQVVVVGPDGQQLVFTVLGEDSISAQSPAGTVGMRRVIEEDDEAQ